MQIKVFSGRFDDTCTVSSNLTENQAKMPVIRDVIQYAEPRMLSTLIVSGAKSPWDLQNDNTKSKIGVIPSDKLIGDNAYRYNVIGRIQQKSVINAQVGTSGPDGSFQLSMRDNYITNGMNVGFWYPNLQARVMGNPTGGGTNFIYSFQTVDGSVFNYATMVAPQPGEKTAFGNFSSFSERSLRGYGRTHYPDQFINHLTTQRKTVAISGDALTDVLWVQFNGVKGWMFEKERQARLQFMMEDEYSKWFGISSMKNADGSFKLISAMIDPETGEPVIQGDGVIPQIAGENDLSGSDVDGSATIDDIIDMMSLLEKKCNSVYAKLWYVVTGTDGYGKAQQLLRDYRVDFMGGRSVLTDSQTQKVGGQDIPVGGNFDTFNVNGNQIIFVKHPLWDDEERFSERGSDGKLLQSSMMVFLDMSPVNGRANVEIMGKGAYGINRTNVSAYLNGLTGRDGNVVSSVDAVEFNMLKQDGIFVFNTSSCGILRKSS